MEEVFVVLKRIWGTSCTSCPPSLFHVTDRVLDIELTSQYSHMTDPSTTLVEDPLKNEEGREVTVSCWASTEMVSHTIIFFTAKYSIAE